MRHTLRLATGARQQQAEHEKGSEVWEVHRGGVAPASGAPRGTSQHRESDGGERGKEDRRPGGLHHLRALANAASQARTGPRLPAGDLPAHRLVGQLAHAIELLLHLGPAAALARELGKDGAARSPPQGYMAPVWSLPGDGSGNAEPRGALWPARGSFPRAPPPTPPPAAAPATASSSCAPPHLHSNAWDSLQRRPGLPRMFAPSPSPARGPGSLRRLAGRLAGWSPLRLCGGRRAFWDL